MRFRRAQRADPRPWASSANDYIILLLLYIALRRQRSNSGVIYAHDAYILYLHAHANLLKYAYGCACNVGIPIRYIMLYAPNIYVYAHYITSKHHDDYPR